MTYIIVAIVVATVVALMLKSSKARVTGTMSNLANAGKVVAFSRLVTDLRNNNGSHPFGSDEEQVGLYAAAGVNKLFGEQIAEIHQSVDLVGLTKFVNNWISKDDELLELVVQSIRVLNTARHARSKTVDPAGIETLEQFGARIPQAPTLDNFSRLVRSEIAKLPSDAQTSIRSRFHIS